MVLKVLLSGHLRGVATREAGVVSPLPSFLQFLQSLSSLNMETCLKIFRFVCLWKQKLNEERMDIVLLFYV